MGDKRKKILILGVGDAQLNLIKAAMEFGYYIVVCDLRDDREGSKLADRFYKVDYMDREAILEIAKKEKVDGVISNSEPAMLNVAYLSEQLGLPGNSMESIEVLLSKHKFRDLQRKVGVYAPEHHVVSSLEELFRKAKGMQYPIIIKPTESSGTRGTTKLSSFDETNIRLAYETCREFSRNNKVTAEEYVEMQSLTVNDADIFVLGDEIIWDGWLWENRSAQAPMLPMTEVFPMALPEQKKKDIQDTVNKLIKESGVRHGEYNVETYEAPNGETFVIEINPRQAGNYIPQLIEEHTGVSLTKLLVSTAVDDMSYYEYLKTFERENNYITLQVVFSEEEGIFDQLHISPEIEKYVKWCEMSVKKGDKVVRGCNAAEALAFVDMQFESYEEQHYFTDKIEEFIYPILKK